jgi:transposase
MGTPSHTVTHSGRRGWLDAYQKAACAVAASILTAIYHMLKNGTVYQDLGADHFNRRSKTTQTMRLVKRLENLGYAVEIQPLVAT